MTLKQLSAKIIDDEPEILTLKELSKKIQREYFELKRNHEEAEERESKWILVGNNLKLYLEIIRYNKKMKVK